MRHYKSQKSGEIIGLPDSADVTTDDAGKITVTDAAGNPLDLPDDLVAYTPPDPTLAEQLAAAKARKAAELRRACATAIIAGYTSDALGSTHIYPADRTDQLNLTASVEASRLPGLPDDWTTGFRCVAPADRDRIRWPLVQHTAAQIQQAGLDGMAWVKTNQARLDEALDALDAISAAGPDPLAAVQAIS